MVLIITVIIMIRPSVLVVKQLTGAPINRPDWKRVEGVTAYLNTYMKPGDKVQTLEWGDGTIDALLLAGAIPATPYIYDLFFYHHVSHPYIQTLRKRFIKSLKQSKPRFVIEVPAIYRGWWTGNDTTKEFPELRSLLKTEYTVSQKNDSGGYIIYERL